MRHTLQILLIISLTISFLSYSCDKDDPVNPTDPAFKGDFVSAAHTTSGVASINQNKTTLTLTDFQTDSGPDLNIYLASSTSDVTADYIDLGNIQGVNGDYSYGLPADTDYEIYKYVVVWCVAFNVNFGYALLEPQ